MSEPLPEPIPPRTEHPAHAPSEAELARRNMIWGWSLFALFWILFAGTIGVAYVYLWLS